MDARRGRAHAEPRAARRALDHECEGRRARTPHSDRSSVQCDARRQARHRGVRDLDADRADGLVRAQSRDTGDRQAFQRARDRPAVGRERLHAVDRRADGHGGPAGGHLRTQARDRDRPRDLRHCFHRVRQRARRVVPDHRARRARHRRGIDLSGVHRGRVEHVLAARGNRAPSASCSASRPSARRWGRSSAARLPSTSTGAACSSSTCRSASPRSISCCAT